MDKALHRQEVVELSESSILISKGGREIPIDNNAAPDQGREGRNEGRRSGVPRNHRPQKARKAAAAGAEDGGGRHPRGRHRPRFQQPPHRHPGIGGHLHADHQAGRSYFSGFAGNPGRRRARVRPHPPAPVVQPEPADGISLSSR